MQTAVLALDAEDPTDERSLPIIQRTVQHIAARRGRTVIDVLEPMRVRISPNIIGQAERILDAARQTQGYHSHWCVASTDGK